MPSLDSIVARRGEILALMSMHGASNPRLFGSVARGEDRPESDIDFLVDMGPVRSLVDLIGLQHALEDRLGCRVDLLTPAELNRHMPDRILAEARSLAAAAASELDEASPQVPWRRIAVFRNVIAHQCLGVDVGLVWGIVVRDLPALEREVAQIVRRLDAN